MGGNDYFCSRNFKQANNKINMNSVLEGRPALKKEVEKIDDARWVWYNIPKTIIIYNIVKE